MATAARVLVAKPDEPSSVFSWSRLVYPACSCLGGVDASDMSKLVTSPQETGSCKGSKAAKDHLMH